MTTKPKTVAEETAEALASGEKERITRIAKRVVESRPKQRANLADLGDAWFTIFRGPQGLARRAYIDFLSAPAGSPTRLRFYEIAYDFAKMQAENGAKSVELLSDDELEQEALDLLLNRQGADEGDPKTKEGIELAEKLLLESEGGELSAEECAQLDAEIARMEARTPVDELAANLLDGVEPTDEVE
jgi:hypothetical protein